MKKFILWIILIWVTGTSCNNTKIWQTLKVGGYLLDVPPSFKFTEQHGIDSDGGIITDDTVSFSTDFGYYTDTLFQTPQEYLNKRRFVIDAEIMFIKDGITYDSRNAPKIDVLSIRPSSLKDSDKTGFFSGCDYVALCRHDGKVVNWPIRIPNDIKRHTVKIETFGDLYRRIVIPKKNFKGTTGIYMRDKRDFIDQRNSCYAIVISGESLNLNQQQLALKIFNTLRRNPEIPFNSK